MKIRVGRHLLLLPLLVGLISGGCKKGDSSPTAPDTTPAAEPSFSFTYEGKDYTAEGKGYLNKLTERLTVSSQVKPSTGPLLTLQLNFSLSYVKVDTPMTLTKGDPNPYVHLLIGDSLESLSEDNIFCSRTGGSKAGELFVTRYTANEIAGTFWFDGGCHNAGRGTVKSVRNGKFKISSFQDVK